METLAGWMEPLGTTRTGPQVRYLSRSCSFNPCYIICLALGEPDRVIERHKGNTRVCVIIGKNVKKPDQLADGGCKWPDYDLDCICKI